MKKRDFINSIFYTCIIVLVVITGSIACKTKTDPSTTSAPDQTMAVLDVPALYERKGELAMAAEWGKTKTKVEELTQKLAKRQNDVKTRLQLAAIYINEARITGEHPYYYPAILKILDGVLALDPKNFEAIVYKASVKMSQHQFTEAKLLAEKANALNTENAYLYGVLVDANVELGNYEEAVRMSDKMQALKPSLESYSRASYLREIYGDYPGAIEAMKMAVNAGLPGSEPQCWSKKTLGQLYEKTGKFDLAEQQYREILTMRPSYAFAMEGLARIEKGRKNYEAALELLNKAAEIMPEFSFYEEMADIFALRSEKGKALETYNKVISMLKEDEGSGHIVYMEMCRLYTKSGDYNAALRYALEEYNQRPNNIEVNQSIAWVNYNLNQRDKAKLYIKQALKTGSKDPELIQRARIINASGG